MKETKFNSKKVNFRVVIFGCAAYYIIKLVLNYIDYLRFPEKYAAYSSPWYYASLGDLCLSLGIAIFGTIMYLITRNK